MKKLISLVLCLVLAFSLGLSTFGVTTPVKSIRLVGELQLEKGIKYQLVPTFTPANTTQKAVKYSSSNNNIATVSTTGVIKPIKGGRVTITATSISNSKLISKCKITVLAPKQVTLKWYLIQEEQADASKIFDAANKMTTKDLNTVVDYQFLGWGAYEQKLKLIIASGENYDLCYTSSWINKYSGNVTKGAFIKLDKLLEQHAPMIMSTIPKVLWDGTRIGGSIYGIPNYQVSYQQGGVALRKDIVDKYKFNYKSIKEPKDLEPFFKIVKEKEPGMYCTVNGLGNDLMPYEFVDGWTLPVLVDDKFKLSYAWDNATRQADYKRNYNWGKLGYLPLDPNINKNNTTYADAGKVFALYNQQKPGGDADFFKAHKYEVYNIPLTKPVLGTAFITAALTSVSVASKNPKRSVQFMDYMFSNKDYFNLMVYGIEGVQYNKVGANRIELDPEGSKKYSMYAWELGSQFNAYVLPGQPDDVWALTVKANSEAKASALLGFSFDREPVKSEVAAVEAVFNKYSVFDNAPSMPFEELYTTLKKEYYNAGLQKVMDEMNKQIIAWRKANNK